MPLLPVLAISLNCESFIFQNIANFLSMYTLLPIPLLPLLPESPLLSTTLSPLLTNALFFLSHCHPLPLLHTFTFCINCNLKEVPFTFYNIANILTENALLSVVLLPLLTENSVLLTIVTLLN